MILSCATGWSGCSRPRPAGRVPRRSGYPGVRGAVRPGPVEGGPRRLAGGRALVAVLGVPRSAVGHPGCRTGPRARRAGAGGARPGPAGAAGGGGHLAHHRMRPPRATPSPPAGCSSGAPGAAAAPRDRGEPPGDQPGSLFRAALVPLFVTHMMAPYLGMAQAALEHVLDTAPSARSPSRTTRARPTPPPSSSASRRRPPGSTPPGRWPAAPPTAWRATPSAGTTPEQAERARIRGWTGYVVSECRAGVDLLASAQGASTFAEQGLLGAIVRDMHTASRHAIASPKPTRRSMARRCCGSPPTSATWCDVNTLGGADT